jgi:hypothetical protein
MVPGAVWQALKESARVVAWTNLAGFLVTAATASHKVTDLTGTAAFAVSAVATHVQSCRFASGM